MRTSLQLMRSWINLTMILVTTVTTPERSFLRFLGSESVPILPHEYGGFTSRKIPKPQNLLPESKNNLSSEDPNLTPLKK